MPNENRGKDGSWPSGRGPLRLQVFLARSGAASRRQAEELIAAGRVRVNGHPVTTPGTKVLPGRDRVELDGVELRGETPRYILLNKPAGYICSLSDGFSRPLVTELLPEVKERVVPVGRLDLTTEGMLLLSNDGEFCHLLTHPRHRVGKRYRARLRRPLTPDQVRNLSAGVDIGDDRPTAPARVRIVSDREVELVLREGRKRQVRRMVRAVGNRVEYLERIGIGPLRLGGLERGSWRDLTREELAALKSVLSGPETGMTSSRTENGDNLKRQDS